MVADGFGAEVGAGDLLHDFVQQVGILQLANELGEFEVLEDFASVFGETVDIREQVAFDVGATQFGQVHWRRVVERLLRRLQQELLASF